MRLGPLQELQFWQERAQDLNSVSAQLTNAKTAKLLKLLEVSQSTYCPGFVRHASVLHPCLMGTISTPQGGPILPLCACMCVCVWKREGGLHYKCHLCAGHHHVQSAKLSPVF